MPSVDAHRMKTGPTAMVELRVVGVSESGAMIIKLTPFSLPIILTLW